MKHKISIILIILFAIEFSLSPIGLDQIENNIELNNQQTKQLQCIINDLQLIHQIICFEKQRWINSAKISLNQELLKEHNDIMNIVFNELKLIMIRIEDIKLKKQIQINTNEIIRHSNILSMILRELEALNRILIINGMQTEVQCEEGKTINLIFTANKKSDSRLLI